MLFSGFAFGQQSTLERFSNPGADVTYARGSDAQGRIVGSNSLSFGGVHGYVREANGTLTTLEWPGGTYTAIEGLSAGGIAVAYVVGAGPGTAAEYAAGTWTALPALPMATGFLQGAIDAGARVGTAPADSTGYARRPFDAVVPHAALDPATAGRLGTSGTGSARRPPAARARHESRAGSRIHAVGRETPLRALFCTGRPLPAWRSGCGSRVSEATLDSAR